MFYRGWKVINTMKTQCIGFIEKGGIVQLHVSYYLVGLILYTNVWCVSSNLVKHKDKNFMEVVHDQKLQGACIIAIKIFIIL